jgi:hypothetical protein
MSKELDELLRLPKLARLDLLTYMTLERLVKLFQRDKPKPPKKGYSRPGHLSNPAGRLVALARRSDWLHHLRTHTAVCASDPANAHSGNWYLSVSNQTQGSWAIATPNGSSWIPVTPNELITVGGWIKRTGGTGSLDYSCEIVDSNYNLVAWCNGAILGDGSGGTSWQYYSGQTTVPTNGAFIKVYAEVHCCAEGDNSATSGDFDDAFVEGASVWSQMLSYDAFGNLQKNGTESFQPTYNSATNQMTSIGSQTPSYDANGDVTNDFLNTYAWDANGRPVTVDGVTVTYDALGRMVEENKGGVYTQFMYSPTGFKMEIFNGQSEVNSFVPLTGGALAVYTPSSLAYYRHADWLGVRAWLPRRAGRCIMMARTVRLASLIPRAVRQI